MPEQPSIAPGRLPRPGRPLLTERARPKIARTGPGLFGTGSNPGSTRRRPLPHDPGGPTRWPGRGGGARRPARMQGRIFGPRGRTLACDKKQGRAVAQGNPGPRPFPCGAAAAARPLMTRLVPFRPKNRLPPLPSRRGGATTAPP